MKTGLATTAEVATYLNVKPNTLDHWASSGEGPKYVKVNGRRRYDWKAVYEYAGHTPGREPAYSPTGYVAELPDGTILPVVDFQGLDDSARVCWYEYKPELLHVDVIASCVGKVVVRPLHRGE